MKLLANQATTFFGYANRKFNDTHIDAGVKYSFNANGYWKDLLFKSNANRYTNPYMNLFNNYKRNQNEKLFTLLGCLKKTNEFPIGKKVNSAFGKSGSLFCFANDVSHFYWNNSGSLELKITRTK